MRSCRPLHFTLAARKSVRSCAFKARRNRFHSSLAQGGVAAVLSLENDSYELHYNDTMIAGGQANTPDAVNTLVHEGPDQYVS